MFWLMDLSEPYGPYLNKTLGMDNKSVPIYMAVDKDGKHKWQPVWNNLDGTGEWLADIMDVPLPPIVSLNEYQ